MRVPARRAFLIVVFVVGAAAATAFEIGEFLSQFGQSRDLGGLFVRQLVPWAMWGLLAVPLVRTAIVIGRRRNLVVVLVGNLVFAGLVALGMTAIQDATDYMLFRRHEWQPAATTKRSDASERSEAERSAASEEADAPAEPSEEVAPDSDDDGREASSESSHDRSRRRRRRRRPSLFGALVARSLLVHTTIVGLGLAVAATLRARDVARRSAELELTTTRLEVELGAARMAALQRQLRPHFLLNALHAVGGLVRQGRGREVQQVLAGLGALLRTSLRSNAAADTRLADELDLARHYLDIEAIRLGDRLTVDVPDVAPELAAVRVPPLLLLPLIENAVQHGIAPREEGGTVSLRVDADGDDVVIVVRDDGPGFDADVLAGRPASDGDGRGSGASIGLSNTRARVDLIAGASLDLANDGGARVTIRLPRRGAS